MHFIRQQDRMRDSKRRHGVSKGKTELLKARRLKRAQEREKMEMAANLKAKQNRNIAARRVASRASNIKKRIITEKYKDDTQVAALAKSSKEFIKIKI